MPVIPAVIEQHAEEAAFLWLLRDSTVHELHSSLSDLAHLDDRVEDHIDGLRIAGDEGWELCKEALTCEEAGEIFAAGVLAFEHGIEDQIQAVLKAGTNNYMLSRGLISALGWIPFEQIENHTLKLIEDEFPDLRSIGLAALSVHRKDPKQYLMHALQDTDAALRAHALLSSGELGRKNLLPAIMDHLDEEE